MKCWLSGTIVRLHPCVCFWELWRQKEGRKVQYIIRYFKMEMPSNDDYKPKHVRCWEKVKCNSSLWPERCCWGQEDKTRTEWQQGSNILQSQCYFLLVLLIVSFKMSERTWQMNRRRPCSAGQSSILKLGSTAPGSCCGTKQAVLPDTQMCSNDPCVCVCVCALEFCQKPVPV